MQAAFGFGDAAPASGPFVFLGTAHWAALPVEALLRPLLARSPYGDLSKLILVTDDLDEAFNTMVGDDA